jgi:hypothetical protein
MKVTVGQPKQRDPYAIARARREAPIGGVRGKGKGYTKRDRKSWRGADDRAS